MGCSLAITELGMLILATYLNAGGIQLACGTVAHFWYNFYCAHLRKGDQCTAAIKVGCDMVPICSPDGQLYNVVTLQGASGTRVVHQSGNISLRSINSQCALPNCVHRSGPGEVRWG